MDPRARVEAFLVDYAAAHAEVLPLMGDREADLFGSWRARLTALERAHFADPAVDAPVGGFSSRAEFDPAMVVSRVEVYGTAARLRLEDGRRASGPAVYEVELVEVEGDWRIAQITGFYDEPGSPITSAAALRSLLEEARLTKALSDLDEDDNPDLDAVFATGRARVALTAADLPPDDDREDSEEALRAELARARAEAEVVDTELVELGTFSHGGVLAVGDPGYHDGLMQVCALTVEPGSATGQAVVVRSEERVAAVRAVLDNTRPVRWQRALLAPGAGFVIGVDSGTGAVVDAVSYLSMSHRDWSRAMRAWVSTDAALLDPGTGPVGVVTRSGWGDGGYGVYWGLDGQGRPVQLVIDYGLLWEPVPEAG
ncbi:DUF4241 domain-containing protein [Actinomyces howellii]|uniref:Uncharacterized protein n=1 Tax=Actinomyces howellii TaxID=52771 RepID=A0A3S4RUS2_9ACTO|nr:DUF4241 domain-containing protein [Actinomyces howellii]VEG25436.1 Uncharacterised protein [Actinomyces howellii]